MNDSFRILVAYDDSDCAKKALKDLQFAGLPEKEVELLVISVAEIWLPPMDSEPDDSETFLTEGLRKKREKNLQIFEDTKQFAEKAAEKVRSMFPDWKVRAEGTYGSPAWEILWRADKFKPDLIVVGSQGLSALQRIWLGSISRKLVTEADCSVRVVRESENASDTSETRILIGFDGTDGAEKAIQTVADRQWSAETEIRVVIAEDFEIVRAAYSAGEDVSDFEKRGEEIVRKLQDKGLKASLKIVEGDPKNVLIEEAEDFRASCIFVGATKFSSKMERLLIGSISFAITTRAHCPVEVVRPNYYKDK